ncbi:MAG: hypothetical protein ABIT04_05050 [Novosphingobium sp.]
MVDDPDNQYALALDDVKNPVLSVNETADALTEIRPERRGERIVAQPNERGVKAMHVNPGYIIAEMRDAEFVDLNQIRFGSIRELDLSHPLPGAWR